MEHFRLATLCLQQMSGVIWTYGVEEIKQEIQSKMLQGVTRLANDKGEHEVDEGGDGLPG